MTDARLLAAAKRLVVACDAVGPDPDTLSEPYYEWCAAVFACGEIVKEIEHAIQRAQEEEAIGEWLEAEA